MAVAQPIATDFLNSPSHSKLHRVVAADTTATDQAFAINASDQIEWKIATKTVTFTHAATDARTITFPNVTGTLYISGGTDVAVADGGTGGSSASITLFNNITGYTASGATGTTSTNLVFSGAPTFTTSITDPLVIGGTGTTSTLSLRATSGVGTTGADIIFQVGNNGATEAMRIVNAGQIGLGKTPETDWEAGNSAFEVGGDANIFGTTAGGASGYFGIGQNLRRVTGGGYKYQDTDEASLMYTTGGAFYFYNVVSGTADDAATLVEGFQIAADGGIVAKQLLQQTSGGLVVEYDITSEELYAETSTARFKENIKTRRNWDTSGLLSLEVKNWKDKESQREEYGLIAEEVAITNPELVVMDKEAKPLGLKYTRLVIALLDLVKQQENRIRLLEAK